MKTKECTKCKKELPNTEEYFHFDKSKLKLGHTVVLASACKKCKNDARKIVGVERRKRLKREGTSEYQHKKQLDPNYLEKFKERQKRYKERINERNRIRWQSDAAYRDKWNQHRRNANKRDIENLVDYYVARLLARRERTLKPKAFLPEKEIIEVQRQKTTLFRYAYQDGTSDKNKN